MGTASLILGILAIICCATFVLFFIGGPLALVGLVLALGSFGRVRRGEATNRGVVIAAMVVNAIALVLAMVFTAIAVIAVKTVIESDTGTPSSAGPSPAVGVVAPG